MKRLAALMLTFLLCFGITANFGITSVFAGVYGKTSRVYVGDLNSGDILNEGAKIYGINKENGFKTFRAYIGDTRINESETEMDLTRRLMLIDKKRDSNNADKLIMHFEDVRSGGNASSEGAMRTLLKDHQDIELSSDITLQNHIEFNDGKTYVINTNGFSITLKGEKATAFVLRSGSTLILKGTNGSLFTGGNSNNDGGAVYVTDNSSLHMQNIRLYSNKAQRNGGGVYVHSGSAEFTKCTFESNSTSGNGGALYVDKNGSAKLEKCTLVSNSAFDGGGIASRGKLTLEECKITNNSAKGGGAGIWSQGTSTLNKTDVKQNSNAVNGGGLTNHGDMTLKDCTVSNNNVSNEGGGMYIKTNGKTVLENSVINGNVGKTGAGFSVREGNLEISGTSINNNVSNGAGGGIWADSGTTLKFTDVNMEYNSCKTNGGSINSHGTVKLKGCTISSSSSDNCGGGIYMDSSSTLTIEKSEITNCMAKLRGGGIYLHSGSVVLAGGKTVISGSTADYNDDNICFREYKNLKITGEFSSGSQICFTPPKNSKNAYVTTDYSKYNSEAPSKYFSCDTTEYKIDSDKNCKEVRLLEFVLSTHTSYKVKVYVKVTDDADCWDWAYFEIFGKSNRGLGGEHHLNTSGDFHTSIDDDGESYTYEYDCGADNFPSAVNFKTSFGSWGTWRDFEGDVKIYINGKNVCNRHVVHKVYGDEAKSTKINIGGDKYPYPDPDGFKVDGPNEIDVSDTITISAIDQYGLTWRTGSNNITMENISFPEEDTFEAADKSGSKWKLSSDHKTNHISTYEITYRSGSNVYPKITKAINVKFVFPLHLIVMIKDEKVLDEKGLSKDVISVKDLKTPTGYYIQKYNVKGVGLFKKGKDYSNFEFTFVNESVTYTAVLKPNHYRISFEPNGEDEDSEDVMGDMDSLTTYYDTDEELPENCLERDGYEFVGWNTQADGMGTMFEDQATVRNLTSKKGDTVSLYAIWKPVDGATTASIFSDGKGLIYFGIAALAVSVAAVVIYSIERKRRMKNNGQGN